mmetsp:Transcript_31326/g.67796  ORF Transcript_31326/g.67796 Transcript_31326/m.67796 type:complete len:147 (+) Transcript_31326:1-441(+)
MLMFCLGGQIGEAVKATEVDSGEFKWFRSDEKSFHHLLLLCSVDKMKRHITDKAAVKAHLFGIGKKDGDATALEDGKITEGNTIGSIRTLVKFAKGRKDGKKDKNESKAPFGADKTILFDLDVLTADDAFDAEAELIERVYFGCAN